MKLKPVREDFDSYFDDLVAIAEKLYPGQVTDEFLKQIISPFSLELPSKIRDQIYSVSPLLFEEFSNLPLKNNFNNDHPSVLMAYDFHYSPEEDSLKLIEINTNSSSYLIVNLLHQLEDFRGFEHQELVDLIESFHSSLKFFDETKTLKKVAIIDEEIDGQFMRPEFFMYKKLLEHHGVEAEVRDYSEPVDEFDFVYNRYCDFELNEGRSGHLKQSYLSRKTCFSPHPADYLKLADKNRLWQLGETTENETVKRTLLKTWVPENYGTPEDIWKDRKNLFFKPPNSHGGKSVYRGKSMSKKKFEELLKNSFLVQEFCPADTAEDHQGTEWKYDIRVYFFNGKVQLIGARVYKGQVTNFKEAHSGFATIIWN